MDVRSALKVQAEPGEAIFVAFPGWATDHEVFTGHKLPGRIVSMPAGGIEQVERPVWLLGWSLGAHTAIQIAAAAPTRVLGVILAGVRPIYPQSAIDAIRTRLASDPQACLASFYRQCFHAAPREWRDGDGKRIIESYNRPWDTEMLTHGLDTLASKPLDLQRVRRLKILVIHGERDRVAPLEEARAMAEALEGTTFRAIPSAGHAVFLDPRCTEAVAQWI